MTKDTVTPKDIETQHLKLSDAVYRDFLDELSGLSWEIKDPWEPGNSQGPIEGGKRHVLPFTKYIVRIQRAWGQS
jgi:hypothetical protein